MQPHLTNNPRGNVLTLLRFQFIVVSAFLGPCLILMVPETLYADGLQLKLDSAARVTGMAVGATTLQVTPGPLVNLCDVQRGAFQPPTLVDGNAANGLILRFDPLRATATVSVRPKGDGLGIACRVCGDDLPARGMLLRFALPLNAIGWRWYNDMQDASVIEKGKHYENTVPLRAWADLPEWKDQPDLRMGYSNRNFCTAIAGPVGVCLAVPIDRPCIARSAYDAKCERLELVYDFALSPDTRAPNEVDFAFDLYACDPKWGLRGALEKYYAIYPRLFERLVQRPGQWMAFNSLSKIDNANEFLFALQEGAPEPAYDDKLDVLSVSYLIHAGMPANIPNYDPEKTPLPSHEIQVQAMREAFRQSTGVDNMFDRVGLFSEEGKLDVRPWSAYAHLIAQFNLDPELPYGRWLLDAAAPSTGSNAKTKGGGLDGFYYDGLTAGLNYRPDHFKTSDAPCLWDPVAKKPFLNNFFSSCEFARAAAERLRPGGRITMMNGALGASFFVAPWLDVFGAETGVRVSRPDLNYIRSITHHKPFLTLLKGNYERTLGRKAIESHMQQCLAYGIPPGFFDWTTSALGPGGCYWDHPRYYERDRDLFRKYEPLCQTLARAGWEPVTHARSSRTDVFVERFGPSGDGVLWLSLLNEASEARKTLVTIDADALPTAPESAQAVEVVAEAPVALFRDGKVLTATLDVPANGARVLQIASPASAARWRVAQARETLARSASMRMLDAEKPPRALHWIATSGSHGRDLDGGKPRLVLTGNVKTSQAVEQWVMLFQPKPTPVKLRVRARGDGLVGGEGDIDVQCRTAWVTPAYTHHEDRPLHLPLGTYDWRDFELVIDSPEALRAIRVSPQLAKGVQGTLRIAEISISDANRSDYVVDPAFAEWYEPMPEAVRQTVDERCRAIGLSLVECRDTAPAATVAAILQQITALRGESARQKAQDSCRRVLRDIETIEHHLNLVVGKPT
jgi:hypothetical protein